MPEYDDNQKTLIEESNAQFDSENTKQYRLNSTVRDLVATIKNARAHYNEVFESILGSTEELKDKFLPYKDHPWSEINRAPAGPIGHFIAYANYKGITSHEIAEMLKNPDSDVAKATEQKLRDIKEGYFDMVAATDTAEKIGSIVSYCENVKNDLPRIHSFIKDVDAMQENIYEILALGDIHSFLQQDYHSSPGKNNQYLENVKFLRETNEALEKKIGVGMDDIYRSLYAVTLVTNRLKADVINTDGNLKNETLFDAPSLFSTVYVCDETRKVFENAKSLDEGIKAFSKKFIEAGIENAGNDLYFMNVGISISAVDKKLLDLCQSPSYEERKGANFLKQLNGSKRPFGQLSDSSEFKDVKEKLKKFLEGKKQPLNTDRVNLEELKASCEKYLKDHSPKSDEGKDRFKLINKVLRYADDNLVRMTNLTNSEAFREKAKKSAMEGLKKTVEYEGVATDKRLESVKKTCERYAASRGADPKIEHFLENIAGDYKTIARAADKGEKLFDDPSGMNQVNVKEAFARVQIYEMFRGEYQPETGQYDGPISKSLRAGALKQMVDDLYYSDLSKKFIDSNSKEKTNNLKEFLDMSPINYLKLVAEEKEKAKQPKKKRRDPSRSAEKQQKPSVGEDKQVKPTEIKPPTA